MIKINTVCFICQKVQTECFEDNNNEIKEYDQEICEKCLLDIKERALDIMQEALYNLKIEYGVRNK